MNSYYDALKNQLVKSLCIEESHFYYESLKDARDENGKIDYPVFLFTSTDYWEKNDNQSDIDLSKEIRVNTNMKLGFATSDIDEFIRYEEFIRDFYSRQQMLSNFSKDDSVKYTTASLRPGVDPEHISEKDYYLFEATLSIKDFIQKEEIINPIKIELDMPTQKKVMSHLSMVNEAWRDIFSEREKIKDSDVSKEQYDFYSKQLSDLEKQAADIYNFKNLTKVELTLENDGFLKCYKLMCKQDINVTEASEIFQNQIRQEQERAKATKDSTFSKEQESTGTAENASFEKGQEGSETSDEILFEEVEDSLDKYTNLIVSDLKEKLNLEVPISIYGGSSYMRFIFDDKAHRINYPLIVVRDGFQIIDATSYSVLGAEGIQISRKSTIRALPIRYIMNINIFTRTEEQLLDLERQVYNLYESEKVFTVENPVFHDNYCVVRVAADTEQPAQRAAFESGNNLYYRSGIPFKAYPNVYYVTDYTKDQLKNNFRLQWFQIKVAEGYMVAISTIDNIILKELDKLQILMSPNQEGAVGRLFKGSDYMELHRCFLNHRPIRRETFEKVFSRIVKYHPSLFDEITSGMSVSEIKNNVEKYKKEIDRKIQLICANLNIPVILPGFENENGRSHDALLFYIKAMWEDLNLSAEAAVAKYIEFLRQKREIQAQRQEEYNYSSSGGGSSSGGMGFVGTTAASTAGTWLGTTGIRREERKQTEIMRDEINRQKEYEKKMEREAHSRREAEQRREHNAKVEQAKKDHMDRLHRSQEEYRRRQKSTRH